MGRLHQVGCMYGLRPARLPPSMPSWGAGPSGHLDGPPPWQALAQHGDARRQFFDLERRFRMCRLRTVWRYWADVATSSDVFGSASRAARASWLEERVQKVAAASQRGGAVPDWRLVRSLAGRRRVRGLGPRQVLRDSDGIVVESFAQQADMWLRHFVRELQAKVELLCAEPLPPNRYVRLALAAHRLAHCNDWQGPLTDAVAALCSGSAPGPDGLSPEFYKVAGPPLLRWLAEVASAAVCQGIPERWKDGVMVSAPRQTLAPLSAVRTAAASSVAALAGHFSRRRCAAPRSRPLSASLGRCRRRWDPAWFHGLSCPRCARVPAAGAGVSAALLFTEKAGVHSMQPPPRPSSGGSFPTHTARDGVARSGLHTPAAKWPSSPRRSLVCRRRH